VSAPSTPRRQSRLLILWTVWAGGVRGVAVRMTPPIVIIALAALLVIALGLEDRGRGHVDARRAVTPIVISRSTFRPSSPSPRRSMLPLSIFRKVTRGRKGATIARPQPPGVTKREARHAMLFPERRPHCRR
jgi:hypothetical protein